MKKKDEHEELKVEALQLRRDNKALQHNVVTLQNNLVTKMEENALLQEKMEKITYQHTLILTQLLA